MEIWVEKKEGKNGIERLKIEKMEGEKKWRMIFKKDIEKEIED